MTRENNKEVIWICVRCWENIWHVESKCEVCRKRYKSSGIRSSECGGELKSYIPLSQYEVLESKLALAVLALQRIIEFPITDKRYVPIFQRHAQEALEAIEAVEHE